MEIFGYPPGPYALPQVFNGLEVELAPLFKDTESDIPKYGVGGYNP